MIGFVWPVVLLAVFSDGYQWLLDSAFPSREPPFEKNKGGLVSDFLLEILGSW